MHRLLPAMLVATALVAAGPARPAHAQIQGQFQDPAQIQDRDGRLGDGRFGDMRFAEIGVVARDLVPPEATAGIATERLLAALADAVRYHPRVQGSVARSAEAEEAITEARAALFPQIEASLDVRRGVLSGDRLRNPRIPESRRTDLVLLADQLIYDFGATFERIEAVELRSEASRAMAAASANAFALSAAGAHFDVVRARALVEIGRRNVVQLGELEGMVRERIEARAAAQSDLLRAESRLTDAQATHAAYQGELDRAEATYREIFGVEAPAGAVMPPPGFALPESADAAIERARIGNYNLRAQRRSTAATGGEYEATKAGNLPRRSFEVTGTRYDLTEGGGGRDLYDVGAGLRLRYSLYTGGADTSRERQAHERVRQAHFDERALELEVERAVRYAYADILVRDRRLRALELTVQADEANIVAYFEQFAIGRRDLLDLLDMQRDLFASVTGLVDARVETALARFTLMALTGDLLAAIGAEDVVAGIDFGPVE